MSTERLVQGLSTRLKRRKFLARTGAGALTVVLGLMGQSTQAAATVHYICCNLCFYPSSSCGNNCTTCAWCWICTNDSVHYWACCECHNQNDGCGSAVCDNVYCSYVNPSGNAPIRRSPAVAGDQAGPVAQA
jgi:hypothetical protein